MDYLRAGKPAGLTFRQYLHAIGFTDPAADTDGMDDAVAARRLPGGGARLVSVPHQQVRGRVRVVVLLIEFPDRRATRPASDYRDLLFADRVYPTGSLRDYYREVSGGRVDIDGEVHGWLRMPRRYAEYTNRESGLGGGSYPRNAQRMAEDAVRRAVRAGVPFPAELDALGDGTVTALVLVHAGPGGETFRSPAAGRDHIWSHKWTLHEPVAVGDTLLAATYMTVPEDCRMGVVAHELGHLVFQWEDFYDPNGGDDGVQWSGTGRWDLMAGGSWNGDLGDRPAHPIGLHKTQHGWVRETTVTASGRVVLPPFAADGGAVAKVVAPAYGPGQFLLLENRQRVGFDNRLPGDGLLVWRVDLARDMNAPFRPACQLVQADGRQDLENSANLNQGDGGDPFPGTERRTTVGDTGLVSTSFPGGPRSGVSLSGITVDPATGAVTVEIAIAPVPAGGGPPSPSGPEGDLAEVGRGPTPPLSPFAAGLANLFRQKVITSEELAPFVRAATLTPGDIERHTAGLPAVPGEHDAPKPAHHPKMFFPTL